MVNVAGLPNVAELVPNEVAHFRRIYLRPRLPPRPIKVIRQFLKLYTYLYCKCILHSFVRKKKKKTHPCRRIYPIYCFLSFAKPHMMHRMYPNELEIKSENRKEKTRSGRFALDDEFYLVKFLWCT